MSLTLLPLPSCLSMQSFFFFFNDTATTEIYTLSLHDALPISAPRSAPEKAPRPGRSPRPGRCRGALRAHDRDVDRKSTRLNSSHGYISYAVFCLKKKKKTRDITSKRLCLPTTMHTRATLVYIT